MFFHKKNIFLVGFALLLFSFNNWAQTIIPPTLTASGNQAYCPLSAIKIVTDFDIENPDNVSINKIYIQISEGYVRGQDKLELTGTHPNITAKTFIALEGKLELEWIGAGVPNDAEIIAAVKDVQFESSSINPSNDKTFSITIGEADYLPLTGHYYKYIPNLGITWKQAKTAAENSNYYGLQGYLATLTSAEETQLCGEQAAGAGWIGGSDEATEGTWKWVTGPEAGGTFWLGNGNGNSNGTDYPYANWNAPDEPNNAGNNGEDYAHIVHPNLPNASKGEWNDLANEGYADGDTNYYEPKGYIVEYGGMPGDPVLNISASSKIYIPKITSTSSPTAICGSGSTTLSATSNTGFVMWFDALSGGTKLGSGDTYTLPSSISTSTSYYALASSDGICETGERTKIEVIVNTIPTITSVSPPTTICGEGIATLTATASAGTINWYDALGNLLATGVSFTPASTVSSNTIYYVDATENGCTTLTRTPVYLNVQYTNPPTATSPQTFCDIENATLADLTITGTSILWYATATAVVALPDTTLLVNNTIYYASQTENTCESPTRLPISVSVFETVIALPPANIPIIESCDSTNSGSDTDGYTLFDLTQNEGILLNGKNAADFTFSYFTDSNYLPGSEILNSTNFENTIQNGQPIHVKIANIIDSSCFTDTSFDIKVNSLPVIQPNVTLKNCDEDGNPDGFTDFNLTEADPFITYGDTSLSVTYYSNFQDANTGNNPINSSPYNNALGNTVYGRVENLNSCHRVATISLEVSVTSFPPQFNFVIEQCDNDSISDGFTIFDLTEASTYFLSQLPPQNLSVHYFRNSTDAQLSQNEIFPQENYINEETPSQTLFVRVQSEDDGGCYGIGPHLTLNVNPRPEFKLPQTEIVCLNLPPITLVPFNEQGNYTYEWFNEAGISIGSGPSLEVSIGGNYTAIATDTSSLSCESFPQTVTVIESEVATITQNDISITDDSDNNSITINNQNNNLGLGEYEFSLGNINGPYQDDAVFENVEPGIYTIYVNDKNSCGIASIEVSVIGYPKFFTPNYDGFNDTWQVKGVSANFYPSSLIYIFDRFGKLITTVDPTSDGWNGLYNNEILPATDYWFTAQLIDENGNIREKKGHFSLIR